MKTVLALSVVIFPCFSCFCQVTDTAATPEPVLQNTAGIYVIPVQGLGVFYQHRLPRLSLRAALVLQGYSLHDEGKKPVRTTDSTFYFQDITNRPGIYDLKLGVIKEFSHISVGADLILGYYTDYRHCLEYYVQYQQGPTGLVSYLDKNDEPVSHPDEAYPYYTAYAKASVNYMAVGFSPTFDIHYSGHKVYLGIQFAPAFKYYTFLNSEIYDPLKLLNEAPRNIFAFESMILLQFGIHL